MEKLLHFAWNGRGDTTSAERLTARTAAVAAYLAEGGGVGGARLMRDRMLELSTNDASRVISNLKDDEGHAIDRLAKPPLFNPKAQDAPEVFQRTAAILLDFPAVPADAGKTAIANDRVALARDQNGQLQIRNLAMGLTRVGVPDGNTGFSAQKLQDVRDVFDQVASKPYSTQGIVLDFMRFFRETNQARAANGEAPLSLAEARQRYQPDEHDRRPLQRPRRLAGSGHGEDRGRAGQDRGHGAHRRPLHGQPDRHERSRLDRPGRLHQDPRGRKPRPAASRTSTSSFRSRTTRTRSACC